MMNSFRSTYRFFQDTAEFMQRSGVGKNQCRYGHGPGITFAADRGEIYFPLHEAEQRLNFRIAYTDRRKLKRNMTDGTPLISLAKVAEAAVKVKRVGSGKNARMHYSKL